MLSTSRTTSKETVAINGEMIFSQRPLKSDLRKFVNFRINNTFYQSSQKNVRNQDIEPLGKAIFCPNS